MATQTLERTRSSRDAELAKKRPTPATTKRAGRTKVPLYVEVDPALREAVNKATKVDRRGLATFVSMALEERLKLMGLWPPPQTD